MSRRREPQPRANDTLAIADAIGASAALQRLGARLAESQRRMADIADALPAALRDQVRSGALDEQRWTLLAPNAAAAAKLRNLLPLLAARLAERGWPERALRVKTLGEREA